jgi:hypothetical protein
MASPGPGRGQLSPRLHMHISSCQPWLCFYPCPLQIAVASSAHGL